jgi:oligopeptide transport system substrate-binding protein
VKRHHASIVLSSGHPSSLTRRTFGLLAACSAVGLLAGCTVTKNPGAGVPGGNGNAGTLGKVETTANTLRYALTAEATTLDPALVEDGTTIDLLQCVFEGLVKWDEQNRIVPGMAEKWEVSPDGKTYTFHIRHGVKFHNGREMTAKDFKSSIDRACDPATKSTTAPVYLKDIVGVADRLGNKQGVTEISGIKIVDPYTLTITIDSAKPYWLGNMTYPCAYVVCKEEIERTGGALSELSASGTGPFKLVEFKSNYRVVLAANPDYYGGRPKLDFIERPVLIDANLRLNNYEADKLDIVDLSPRDLDRINADPKLKPDLKAFPRAATWYLGLNQDAAGSPFRKREVRQAFAMAIDKNELLRVALKGQADLATGVVPPGMENYAPKINPLPYDPVKARALLAQAGYPGGAGFPTLTLSFRQDMPWVADTSQVVTSQLKAALGISVQLRPMEWGQFLKERAAKTLAFTHLRWSADYLDPQNFLSTLLHSNRVVNGADDHPENGVGYNNPAFDRLCDQADVEPDVKKRMALYAQAEQMAVDDAPWVPIYYQRDLELIKPRVKNMRNSLLGHLPHVTTTVQP